MSEFLPIDATPDRPEFKITVGDTALEASVASDVMEIDVAAEVNRHGRASLLVQNWSPDTQKVRHSDDGPFAPGQAIVIGLGYHSSLETVFDGVISGVFARFPADGSPTLEVRCHARSLLLDGAPRSRWAEDSKDEDLAGTIADDHGLTADAGETFTQPHLVQHRQTDWQFLLARGQALGWVTYVSGKDLIFKPARQADKGGVSLTWRKNLLDLEVQQDVSRRHHPAEATGWDPEKLEAITASESSDLAHGDRPGVESAVSDTGWKGRTLRLDSCLPVDSAEIDRRATSAARGEELRHITGRGRCLGVPKLAIDTWLKLDGIGKLLNGEHYVTAVRHRLGTLGYHTEFQLGLPTPPSAAAVTASALAGAPSIGSVLTGVVDDLDDPNGWGRVKVGFPWRADATDAVWARLATFGAGESQGGFFVPEVGQEVVVSFVEGDPRFPVVLGSLWNGKQAPPEEIDAAKNDIRSIVTRSGHALRFDDKSDGRIELVSAAGQIIEIDDSAGSISLTEESGSNVVKLDSSGISITAGKGDINLSASGGAIKLAASSLETSSTGATKVTSSATLDLSATATLSAKGALVKIN